MTFYLIEISVLLLSVASFREAWLLGARQVMTFLGGVAFGLAIETYFVTQSEGYTYGTFLLNLPLPGHPVPFWVAAGWGTIIFVAMETSDRTGIPWGLRPLLDGLLAVSLDVTLDPVANHLGWWNWLHGGGFFDVPYDNFLGWIMIVSSYSLTTRLATKITSTTWVSALLVPVAILMAGLLVVGETLLLNKVLYPLFGQALTFTMALLGAIALLTPFLRVGPVQNKPWYQMGVPLYYQGLMLLLLLTPTGVGATYTAAYLVYPLATLVCLLCFNNLQGSPHADPKAG